MSTRSASQGGQSIVEIIIGLALGGLLIVGATTAISSSLKSDVESQYFQSGGYLTQELAINVAAFTKANWRNVYDLSRSPGEYHLVSSGTGFAASAGSETVNINNNSFIRFFTVASTSRDASGNIEASYAAVNEDTSTLEVFITTSWITSNGGTASSTATLFLTRHRNSIFSQTDWSGNFLTPAETVVLPNNAYTKFETATDVATSTVGQISINGL